MLNFSTSMPYPILHFHPPLDKIRKFFYTAIMSEVKIAPVENKMGTMPVVKLILNMSLPMMFSMLVQSLYNIVDSIFVAKIAEDALTAVSLAFPVQNLMIAFGVGTSVGVNAMLSMRLGQKNQDDVNKYAMNGIFLAICNYVAFFVLGALFIKIYLASQTTSLAIRQYGSDYLSVVMFLGFGVFIELMFNRLLQSTGRTFLSMISQVIGAVFNIIFDPLLIFGIGIFPALGIKGAAIATVIGQILGAVVSMLLNLAYNHDIQFHLKNIIPHARIIKEIYKIAVPSILLSSIMSFVTYFINLILGRFSMTAIAVYGVYFKLNSFIVMPSIGLNNGIVPIIAYNYGAEHHKRITNTIRAALVMAFCLMCVGVTIFELIPDKLLSLFDASEEMMTLGCHCLRRIAPSFLGAAIAITLSSVFQAVGSAVYSMIVSFARQIIVLLPSAYLLSLTGDVNNVWWCYIIAEFMSVALSLIFMRIVYVKKIKNLPEK